MSYMLIFYMCVSIAVCMYIYIYVCIWQASHVTPVVVPVVKNVSASEGDNKRHGFDL